MDSPFHQRRAFLSTVSALGAGGLTPLLASRLSGHPVAGPQVPSLDESESLSEPSSPDGPHWVASRQQALKQLRYCLNMSTINGGEVPVRQQIQIAAEAGYDGVELWLRDIQRFVAAGGSLGDLAREIADLGLTVDSGIAFGQWIVDDDRQRAEGLEQCRRDMDVLRQLGGKRIAAPPSGVTREPGLDLRAAGDRFRKLIDVGQELGVEPQLELWGFSANLSTLAEVLFVAAAAEHARSGILLDIYHMYKGGSDFSNVGLIPGQSMACLHINDYPELPGRAEISDQDRIYPGAGIAPLAQILNSLVAGGFRGTLSLELFNREYWQQPPAKVASEGLESMRRVVRQAAAA